MDCLGWAGWPCLHGPWSWNAAGSLRGGQWGLRPRWGHHWLTWNCNGMGVVEPNTSGLTTSGSAGEREAALVHLRGVQQGGKLCPPLSLRGRGLQRLQSSTEVGLWCWVVFLSIVTSVGEASSNAFLTALVAIMFSKAVLEGPAPSVCLGQKHTGLCDQWVWVLCVCGCFLPIWRRCQLHSLASFLLFCSPNAVCLHLSLALVWSTELGGWMWPVAWHGKRPTCSSAAFP